MFVINRLIITRYLDRNLHNNEIDLPSYSRALGGIYIDANVTPLQSNLKLFGRSTKQHWNYLSGVL